MLVVVAKGITFGVVYLLWTLFLDPLEDQNVLQFYESYYQLGILEPFQHKSHLSCSPVGFLLGSYEIFCDRFELPLNLLVLPLLIFLD